MSENFGVSDPATAGDEPRAQSRAAIPSPASFRDPSGFIYIRNGDIFRQVNNAYRAHYDKFLKSGLYDALIKRGWLIEHEESGEPAADEQSAYKVLKPRRIDFISYPYEWAFSQLQDAALLTLDVQS